MYIALTPSIRQHPTLFALIIGIDKYKTDHLRDLKAAVSDANAMRDYLRETLGVPTSRIKTLFNEDATHDGIIQEMRALQNIDTKEGDPILIYYAGHGVVSKDWADDDCREIGFLAPHDVDYTDDKRVVNGISDHAIGILLEDLAKAKGDNIVRLVCTAVRSDAHLYNTDGRI
jgi:hypothetical protein